MLETVKAYAKECFFVVHSEKEHISIFPFKYAKEIWIIWKIDQDHIATLTINRPEKKNAFSGQTIAELSHAFASVGQNQEIRGLIIKGSGDYFCAGADLTWMKDTAR